MSKARDDILIFGGVGLMVSAIPAVLVAGGYCLWAIGLSPFTVEFETILRFAPWRFGPSEPFQTGLFVGLGVWLAGGIAAIALGFRPEQTSHGSAQWASKRDIRKARLSAPLKHVTGPIFAKFGTPRSRAQFLTSSEIPHSIIAAPTGSGKGVGVVTPTLLTYNGSVVCLDVKGENFEQTSRRRRAMGDKVYKFSPYDAEGRTHRYNPVDMVANAPAHHQLTEARRLAVSLIVPKGEGAEGFIDDAREIFAASVVYVIEQGIPTIGAVYKLFAEEGDRHELFASMSARARSDAVKSVFNRMAATEHRTLSIYLSVLNGGGLNLWADPNVCLATNESDFSFATLRETPGTVYFVVSPNDLITLSAIIRLMFQQAVAVLQQSMPGEKDRFPVLFLMDEFASLGKMETLSTAITTLRGYGGRLMIVVQSLANLAGVYGKEGEENFLANCQLQLFMAPADSRTPEYISKAIGDYTSKARSRSWSMNSFTASNVQERDEGARLIRPEEVRRLGEDNVIALVQNQRPIKTKRVVYYEDRALKRIFEGQKGDLPEPPALPFVERVVVEPASHEPDSEPRLDGKSDSIRPSPNNIEQARKKLWNDDDGEDDRQS